MKYIIDRIPPSNNQFIGRTNYHEYQRVKREWAALIAALCRPRPKNPPAHAIVTLTYFFPDRRRRDPDNYSGKMILDGLTVAGIIADDSFTKIALVLRGEHDPKHPRTEIEIEDAKK